MLWWYRGLIATGVCATITAVTVVAVSKHHPGPNTTVGTNPIPGITAEPPGIYAGPPGINADPVVNHTAHSDTSTPVVTGRPVLRFDNNGDFKITVFEDTHVGEDEFSFGPGADVNTLRVMNRILDSESPQLVVLNGDLITGENTYIENSTDYVNVLVQPMLDHNVPWASTYGNHDNAFNLSTDAIFAREQTFPLSYTQKMLTTEKAGVTNYWLPVYPSSSTRDGAPAMLLWFFDSRGGGEYQQKEAPIVGVVDSTVADWLLEENANLVKQYGKVIPSLAFVHIPTMASNRGQSTGIDPNKEPGINTDIPLAPQSLDCSKPQVDVKCPYTGMDEPFMEALVKIEGLIGVFSGHDHNDDWCLKWDSQFPDMRITGSGLHLCFGRHTGYGGYGTHTRGSRQIVANLQGIPEREVETWVRLETMAISGHVTLNSTYGQDIYPAAIV